MKKFTHVLTFQVIPQIADRHFVSFYEIDSEHPIPLDSPKAKDLVEKLNLMGFVFEVDKNIWFVANKELPCVLMALHNMEGELAPIHGGLSMCVSVEPAEEAHEA